MDITKGLPVDEERWIHCSIAPKEFSPEAELLEVILATESPIPG